MSNSQPAQSIFDVMLSHPEANWVEVEAIEQLTSNGGWKFNLLMKKALMGTRTFELEVQEPGKIWAPTNIDPEILLDAMDHSRLYIPHILRALDKSELASHAELCDPETNYLLDAVFIDGNAIQLSTDISAVGGLGKKSPIYEILAQDVNGSDNPTWIATIDEKIVKDALRLPGKLLRHILQSNPNFRQSTTRRSDAKDIFESIYARLQRREMLAASQPAPPRIEANAPVLDPPPEDLPLDKKKQRPGL